MSSYNFSALVSLSLSLVLLGPQNIGLFDVPCKSLSCLHLKLSFFFLLLCLSSIALSLISLNLSSASSSLLLNPSRVFFSIVIVVFIFFFILPYISIFLLKFSLCLFFSQFRSQFRSNHYFKLFIRYSPPFFPEFHLILLVEMYCSASSFCLIF